MTEWATSLSRRFVLWRRLRPARFQTTAHRDRSARTTPVSRRPQRHRALPEWAMMASVRMAKRVTRAATAKADCARLQRWDRSALTTAPRIGCARADWSASMERVCPRCTAAPRRRLVRLVASAVATKIAQRASAAHPVRIPKRHATAPRFAMPRLAGPARPPWSACRQMAQPATRLAV